MKGSPNHQYIEKQDEHFHDDRGGEEGLDELLNDLGRYPIKKKEHIAAPSAQTLNSGFSSNDGSGHSSSATEKGSPERASDEDTSLSYDEPEKDKMNIRNDMKGDISCSGHNLPLCWGAQLTGTADNCSAVFVGGSNHFKNKFCTECSKGMQILASQVRALMPETEQIVANKKSAGFWKSAPQGLYFDFRIVNNTLDCSGPKLIVFRGTPPEYNFPPLPVCTPLPTPLPFATIIRSASQQLTTPASSHAGVVGLRRLRPLLCCEGDPRCGTDLSRDSDGRKWSWSANLPPRSKTSINPLSETHTHTHTHHTHAHTPPIPAPAAAKVGSHERQSSGSKESKRQRNSNDFTVPLELGAGAPQRSLLCASRVAAGL